MPKIALISTKDKYCDYCSESFVIADSISDWDDVTEDELKVLRQYSPHIILVREDVKPALERVKNAVKAAELQRQKFKEAEEKKKRAREEKKRQKELLKQKVSEEEARHMYEALKLRFDS